jgi:energy-coupling factor transporter transmembrane protein EcfT
MDSSMSELANRVESVEVQLKELQVLVNKIILMMHIADTDLKNQTHLLDS